MATESAPRRGRPPKNQRESRIEQRVDVSVEVGDPRDHGNTLVEEVELIPGHSQFHLGQLRKLYPSHEGWELTVLPNGNVEKKINKDAWIKLQQRTQNEAIQKSKSETKYQGEGVISVRGENNARFERYSGQ